MPAVCRGRLTFRCLGCGVSERGTCTGSLLSGLVSEANQIKNRRKKKKGTKKETREGDLKALDAGTPVSTKWSHYDGSTPRNIKKGKLNSDVRWRPLLLNTRS